MAEKRRAPECSGDVVAGNLRRRVVRPHREAEVTQLHHRTSTQNRRGGSAQLMSRQINYSSSVVRHRTRRRTFAAAETRKVRKCTRVPLLTLGSKSAATRMLDDLTSRWIMGRRCPTPPSPWRYSRARATPAATLHLSGQPSATPPPPLPPGACTPPPCPCSASSRLPRGM